MFFVKQYRPFIVVHLCSLSNDIFSLQNQYNKRVCASSVFVFFSDHTADRLMLASLSVCDKPSCCIYTGCETRNCFPQYISMPLHLTAAAVQPQLAHNMAWEFWGPNSTSKGVPNLVISLLSYYGYWMVVNSFIPLSWCLYTGHWY